VRILVTGASGLLGLNLCMMSPFDNEIVGFTYKNPLSGVPFTTVNADLASPNSLTAQIERLKPGLVINCAAMSNIDACESQPDEARKINREMPALLAELCNKFSIPLVHISTDAVFDGKTGGYVEEDQPNPLSVYARTKLESEKLVLAAFPRALVLRVNFYGYSQSGNRSIAEFFLNNLLAGNTMNGFTDVIFSPLYVRDLGEIIYQMVNLELSGLFHVVSPESISKYDFGVKIAGKFGANPDLINPIPVEQGGLRAKRSPNLNLKIDKLLKAGITPADIDSGLDEFFVDYQNGFSGRLKSLSYQ